MIDRGRSSNDDLNRPDFHVVYVETGVAVQPGVQPIIFCQVEVIECLQRVDIVL